ncbi:MAG TPA: DUF58 domain-containing protein [Thiolinea sp.]|nr:DUF58 domain-containing protein [Thiolinea sp.]
MLEALQSHFDHWVKQRLPSARSTTLDQSKIFIVPSKTALALLCMIIVLFLLGINFQNSLVYAVCFWLLAMLVVNVLHTWKNLSGLKITAIHIQPCFAGEKAVLELELACAPKQQKFALELAWPQEDYAQVNLVSTQTTRVKLSHSTQRRGRFTPPRINIFTHYPTGLAVAWSYITVDISGLVYPTPAPKNQAHTTNPSHDADQQNGKEISGGSNDFGGIRSYQAGDTPKHIHWAQYAKTGKLNTKVFVDYASHDFWLDWNSLTMPGMEARLSQLCRQVLDAHQAQQQYGLKLPGTTIPPAKGEAHQARCLQALALFGVEHV